MQIGSKAVKNDFRFISGMIAAVFSVVISDMHTVMDLLLSVSHNSFQHMQYPLYLSGLVAGPVTAAALLVFGLEMKALGDKTAFSVRMIRILVFSFAVSHVLLSAADIHYASTIAGLKQAGLSETVAAAGALRGLATLLTGLAGLLLICFFLGFFRKKNAVGYAGALTALISAAVGITAKTLSMAYIPVVLMTVFIVLMLFKAAGFIMICLGLRDYCE